ncbi:hypothetical protein CASFOL_042626 [Castilleja foliolosa]|uniref:Uncharacterized protein n=1 Tax=Castilleja foliolosa TaxID=1961234 RepID=A0ABD3B8D0_9LAMI
MSEILKGDIVPTASSKSHGIASALPSYGGLSSGLNQSASLASIFPTRNITTSGPSASPDVSASSDVPQRIKFKRLDKTARHIMQHLMNDGVGVGDDGQPSIFGLPTLRS